jgi:hypothetical protein
MSNERKKELLNTIVSYLSRTGEVFLNDVSIQNHLTSFLKLHKKEENEIMRQFLKEYCSVLRASKMPFFSLNRMIESYERWKINKGIFKFLLKLSKCIDRQNLTSDFCAFILLKPQVALFEGEDEYARFYTLGYALKQKVIMTCNGEISYPLVSYLLSNETSNKTIDVIRNDFANDLESPLKILFKHMDKMLKNGVNTLDIVSSMRMHFRKIGAGRSATAQYLEFIDVLYEKLPPHFMHVLASDYIDQMYLLFKMNASRFQEWNEVFGNDIDGKKLLRSIIAQAELPPLIVDRFCDIRISQQEKYWVGQLYSGMQLQNHTDLPLRMTRRAIMYLYELQDNEMSISQALVYSLLMSQLKHKWYCMRVAVSIRNFNDAEYWVKAMSILFNRGLELMHVSQVVDYLRRRVLEERRFIDVKHIKIEKLLKDISDWHEELIFISENNYEKKRNRKLANSGIEDFKILFEEQNYFIVQLKNSIELAMEGRMLHHCVSTYKDDCIKGLSYIFSFGKLVNQNEKKSMITIEVQGNGIMQVAGSYNRCPTDKEKEIIRIWANESGLNYRFS